MALVRPAPLLLNMFLFNSIFYCVRCYRWWAQDPDALIAKGERCEKQMLTKEALENYLPANKLEPENVDLLVRIARQYRHLMSDASAKKEKLQLGQTSLEYANRAASLAPNNSEAQLSPARIFAPHGPSSGRLSFGPPFATVSA